MGFFSAYNQVELNKKSRDLTTFMTPLGHMLMTTLLQGVTNSVSQFIRIIHKILASYLQNQVKPHLDDIGIKGLKTKYNNEELALGIRHYVFEYIQNLDMVLADLKRAGITITRAKSQFYQVGLKIMGYICNTNSRHPDISKVLKFLTGQNILMLLQLVYLLKFVFIIKFGSKTFPRL